MASAIDGYLKTEVKPDHYFGKQPIWKEKHLSIYVYIFKSFKRNTIPLVSKYTEFYNIIMTIGTTKIGTEPIIWIMRNI